MHFSSEMQISKGLHICMPAHKLQGQASVWITCGPRHQPAVDDVMFLVTHLNTTVFICAVRILFHYYIITTVFSLSNEPSCSTKCSGETSDFDIKEKSVFDNYMEAVQYSSYAWGS